jgi:hypothetical protein
MTSGMAITNKILGDAIGIPNSDLVLRALLSGDLIAFTQYAFGVVRPGILFKNN